MAKRIAGITIELDADTSKLVKSLDSVSKTVGNIGKSIENVGTSLTKNLTVPIAGAFAGIISTTADFEAQMSKVQAISGATAEEFDALEAKAREMGAATKFSATESGEAFEYMAMAGWKTEDMLNGIEGIMSLAAASGEELGTTSDIVTDALTAFGLSAKDSAHFADVLAAAATNSNTNVSMLGQSFKYAAAPAGALGYSVEDVTLALGLMANSGIKADMAGTSLRNLFQRMAKPTKESAMAMDRLGISLYDDEGKMYSLRQIMDQLRDGFVNIKMPLDQYNARLDELDQALEDGTLTQSKYDKELEELNLQAFGAEGAEKARAAAMLGGTRAMSGLLAIANASKEDYYKLADAIDHSSYSISGMKDELTAAGIGLKEWQRRGLDTDKVMGGLVDDAIYYIETFGADSTEVLEFLQNEYDLTADEAKQALGIITKNMDGTNGAAKEMADIMQDNLTGEITILKSQLQELAISMGEIIMPLLRQLVDKIQAVVDWLNNLSDEQKEHIMKIAAIVAAVGPVLLVIGKVITAISSIVSLVSSLTTIFSLLSPPVLIVVGVIAALVAVGVLLYKNWDTIKAHAEMLWEIIKWKFGQIKDFVVNTWTTIKDTVTDTFNNIKDKIKNSKIGQAVGDVWDAAKKTMFDALSNMKRAYDEHGGGLKGAVSATMQGIKEYYKAGFNFIDNLTNGKLSEMVGKVKDKMSSMFTTIKDTFGRIKDVVRSAVDFIKGLFNTEIDFLHFKLPHFYIDGGQLPWGIGGKGYPPEITVEWYKKAMQQPYMLDGATIFGQAGGKLLGGGETGSEMIIGTNKLMEMISKAKGTETVINNQFNINADNRDPQELAQEISYYLNMEVQRVQGAFA